MSQNATIKVGIKFEYWKNDKLMETITDWCPITRGASDLKEISVLANYWWDRLQVAWKPDEIKFKELLVETSIIQMYDFANWKPGQAYH